MIAYTQAKALGTVQNLCVWQRLMLVSVQGSAGTSGVCVCGVNDTLNS